MLSSLWLKFSSKVFLSKTQFDRRPTIWGFHGRQWAPDSNLIVRQIEKSMKMLSGLKHHHFIWLVWAQDCLLVQSQCQSNLSKSKLNLVTICPRDSNGGKPSRPNDPCQHIDILGTCEALADTCWPLSNFEDLLPLSCCPVSDWNVLQFKSQTLKTCWKCHVVQPLIENLLEKSNFEMSCCPCSWLKFSSKSLWKQCRTNLEDDDNDHRFSTSIAGETKNQWTMLSGWNTNQTWNGGQSFKRPKKPT